MVSWENISTDLENVTLEENYTYEYDDDCCAGAVCDQEVSMSFDSIFIPVVYSLALIVGLVGNVLVLVVLGKKRVSWSVTDIFIFHLSIADCLLLLTLPVWAAEAANGWVYGTGACKLTGALFRINFYCSIFMLSCISLDRYFSIVHAVQMYSRKNPAMIHGCCVTVWLVSLLLSVPDLMYLEAISDSRRGDKTECVHDYPTESWRLASRLLYHLIGFALPAVVMAFCYSRILLRLKRGSQGVQKRRAMRVIVALVLAFFISWTPYNITLMADTIHSNITHSWASCASTTALDVALTMTTTLGYLHCCINPVLYAFVGVKFRQHLLDILRSLGFRIKGPAGVVSRKSSVLTESMDTSNMSF